MLLASYKSTRPGLQGVANRLIRARLRGIYSHNELVFEPGDGVDALMPDGTCAADAAGALWCASSVAAEALPAHSPRRAGCGGGVRFKRIALDPGHWDMRRVACNPVLAAQWFKAHQGELYDWQLIAGFATWLMPHKASRWTCSEACAAALGAPEGDAWRFDPCSLEAAGGAWM
ncbi:hypothetical protein SAMN05428957_10898 [Oryzisolibacter propanilivorax]|uniref:Uncharacterized protein n=1 Tax=Oryzisolibacter propanilivorax TaxID=1527607 RepID=A0A1G9UD37_9BURK|nr:hypothetical protein [Oryzisolibacter propanilivorax]SDM57475.1 hypothetical protein SAMN05428957_10898 [Oryzisolibacter propanilivorax]